jgi:hypothetical protein
MATQRTDPISPWFNICEEMGEFIGIRFGRIARGATEPEWTFLRHIDFDGVGGFGELLRRGGADLPKLPQIKHPAPPSRMDLVRALPKFLKPRQRVAWGPLNRGTVIASTKDQSPLAVAWHVFDEQATTQIRRVCRKSGITVNSFLLKHLTKAIRPSLLDESSVVPWMIPINLRGKVSRERDTANFTSYVGVQICSYESAFDIHRKIYAALGRGEHWANWYAYEVGRLASKSVKKQMLKRDLAMSQWNLGSFSNLGDWDPDKTIDQPECEGPWLFAPPVLRCQMIGAGCVTYQNALSLTIQAHPDLTCSTAVPTAWIQSWIKEIDLDVTSILADAPRNQWLAA